jgi:hypothetical protein
MSTNARKRPAPTDRPSSNGTTRYADLTDIPGHQPTEAPTAEDRADLAALIPAGERGYRIAVQCTCCGHWLTAPKSVGRFMGPQCRTKAVSS